MAETPTEVTWRRIGRFTEEDHAAIVAEARMLGRKHRGAAAGAMLNQQSLVTLVLRNPAGIGWRMVDADLTMDELLTIGEISMLAYRDEAMR